jgi:hypothetical protein
MSSITDAQVIAATKRLQARFGQDRAIDVGRLVTAAIGVVEAWEAWPAGQQSDSTLRALEQLREQLAGLPDADVTAARDLAFWTVDHGADYEQGHCDRCGQQRHGPWRGWAGEDTGRGAALYGNVCPGCYAELEAYLRDPAPYTDDEGTVHDPLVDPLPDLANRLQATLADYHCPRCRAPEVGRELLDAIDDVVEAINGQ